MSPPRHPFRAGIRDCLPYVLIVVPFSTLFGVVARDAGLDLVQVMSMSVIVIAGASQFTALALLQDGAPVFVALLAALAVNLRMAMYSAALVPHLGGASLGARALASYLMVDQSFAVAVRRYEDSPAMTGPEKLRYYFGCMTAVAPLWYACSFAGALMGRAIPASLSLDFAVPVCFIALLAPLLRSLPHLVAAFISALVTVVLAWLPWNLSLPVAALSAMIAGAQAELFLSRRARKKRTT